MKIFLIFSEVMSGPKVDQNTSLPPLADTIHMRGHFKNVFQVL